jgi:macrolide transport system ATP-binding/permease protein
MLISLWRASKSYGPKKVVDDISLVINEGDRCAVIGDNGTGKSTILGMLAGTLPLTKGRVERSPNVAVGYLPQTLLAFAGLTTMADAVRYARVRIVELESQMRHLESQMAEPVPDMDSLFEEYARVTTEFEVAGGYTFEDRMNAIFDRLRVAEFEGDRELATLSGGERTRVSLATLLLSAPKVLLLDEPTNNLDFEQLAWLESYLTNFAGGMLIATHDRDFLDAVCTTLYLRENGTTSLAKFTGTYAEYVAAKELEDAARRDEYEWYLEERGRLRETAGTSGRSVGHNRPPRDNDKFSAHFHRQRVDRTVSRNVRAAEQKLERLEAKGYSAPYEKIAIRARLEGGPRAGADCAVALMHAGYGVDDRCILRDVDLKLRPPDRIALIGANGIGKSTVLRLLAGDLTPTTGHRQVSRDTTIGYLAQEPTLEPACTALETFQRALRNVGTEDEDGAAWLPVRLGLLERGDMRKPVGELSLGQQRRLEIALLGAFPIDALILDEPTNHVTPESVEALESAIATFPGPVITASHDRRFLRSLAPTYLTIEAGALIACDGYVDASARDGNE